MGRSARFRVTGRDFVYRDSLFFSVQGVTPSTWSRKVLCAPVMYTDVVAESCTLLSPPPPFLTTLHPSWMETPPPPPPHPLIPHAADTIPLREQRGGGGGLPGLHKPWRWFFFSFSRYYKVRRYMRCTHTGGECASVSFAPHAPNGWCTELCRTSLSPHVLGLVPIIGHVRKEKKKKKPHKDAPGGKQLKSYPIKNVIQISM